MLCMSSDVVQRLQLCVGLPHIRREEGTGEEDATVVKIVLHSVFGELMLLEPNFGLTLRGKEFSLRGAGS